MYQFSAPMPYTFKDIDKILEINNEIKKSKITSLFACVPRKCEVFTGFEQSRNFAFDCIYLLNSPGNFNIENKDFVEQLKKLDLLLNALSKINVKKLRIASHQLMSYISKNYPYFQILASTCLEYKTICEYQNFLHFHPEIVQIVPSHDVNKNFKLLGNLTKRYPNIEIELMVNEGCLKGCPYRILHLSTNIDKQEIINNDVLCLALLYALTHVSPLCLNTLLDLNFAI